MVFSYEIISTWIYKISSILRSIQVIIIKRNDKEIGRKFRIILFKLPDFLC